MEDVQKELLSVLLERLCSLGLIAESTCSRAVERVHSAAGFPEFFGAPGCLTKEAGGAEHTQDTQ